jgi:hypothetical protein
MVGNLPPTSNVRMEITLNEFATYLLTTKRIILHGQYRLTKHALIAIAI